MGELHRIALVERIGDFPSLIDCSVDSIPDFTRRHQISENPHGQGSLHSPNWVVCKLLLATTLAEKSVPRLRMRPQQLLNPKKGPIRIMR